VVPHILPAPPSTRPALPRRGYRPKTELTFVCWSGLKPDFRGDIYFARRNALFQFLNRQFNRFSIVAGRGSDLRLLRFGQSDLDTPLLIHLTLRVWVDGALV